MRLFNISDLLTATTGRLVSSRHMEGVYEIYNFLTGDNLFTHQLPRAHRECAPWLQTQFPLLMEDSPRMVELLADLDEAIAPVKGEMDETGRVVAQWVERVRVEFGLPEMIPVYEMGADMHLNIDPVEELSAMVGDANVVVIDSSGEPANDEDR